MIYFAANEVIYFYRINGGGAATLLFQTAASYFTINTLYYIKIMFLISNISFNCSKNSLLLENIVADLTPL